MANKSNKISIGNAGEYFVAAKLELHGFTAAVPMSNVKDFDVLAISRENGRQIAIQVKTATGEPEKYGWTLAAKKDRKTGRTVFNRPVGRNVFYVFVGISPEVDEEPRFYVVPSRIVTDKVVEDHANWLNTPGAHGQAHNDNTMRKFSLTSRQTKKFLNAWDQLK